MVLERRRPGTRRRDGQLSGVHARRDPRRRQYDRNLHELGRRGRQKLGLRLCRGVEPRHRKAGGPDAVLPSDSQGRKHLAAQLFRRDDHLHRCRREQDLLHARAEGHLPDAQCAADSADARIRGLQVQPERHGGLEQHLQRLRGLRPQSGDVLHRDREAAGRFRGSRGVEDDRGAGRSRTGTGARSGGDLARRNLLRRPSDGLRRFGRPRVRQPGGQELGVGRFDLEGIRQHPGNDRHGHRRRRPRDGRVRIPAR